MKILLATHNKNKLSEFQAILQPNDIEVVGLCDMPEDFEIDETGNTFLENAALKAQSAFSKFGIPTVADDSGLEVLALDNKPGVFSSRFAGENATDEDNNKKLLEEMKDIAPENRQARFVCVSVLVTALDGTTSFAEGTADGEIIFEPKGSNGFGYDPLFYYPPLKKTFAEISNDEKNTVSHRKKSIQAIRYKIIEFFKS